MFADWRHTYANIALTGGNLFFLLIVVRAPTQAGLLLASILIGTSSLFAWVANLRRYRTIADTPTSRVNSASQGYIELVGDGVHLAGKILVSPVSGQPCLWYRYLVEEKSGGKWRRIESGTSTDILGIDDGAGVVLIDPAGAEVITTNKKVLINGHLRHTEWSLLEHEKLYVIGDHSTQSGSTVELNFRKDVSELLAEWKQDRTELIRQFDSDGNGNISLDEWEAARIAASTQIEQKHREKRLQVSTSTIRKPKDGIYIIANRSPEQMASRYLIWSWVHLGLVIAASLTIAIML